MSDSSEDRRGALLKFMESRGLKPAPFARAAKVSAGALYNFLGGRSESLSHAILEKLADAHHATVAELLGEAPVREPYEGARIEAPPRLGDVTAIEDDLDGLRDMLNKAIARRNPVWYPVAHTAALSLARLLERMIDEAPADRPRSGHPHQELPQSPRDAKI